MSAAQSSAGLVLGAVNSLSVCLTFAFNHSKVLCPHVAFSRGVRAEIDVEDLPALCSSLTFNNCQVYYDALQATVPSLTNGSNILTRSATPSCDSTADPPADGPALGCAAGMCFQPCPAT